MEYIIAVIVSLVGAVLFYRNKANKAEVNSILSETKGRDKELKGQQEEVEAAISELDEGVRRIRKERADSRADYRKKTRKDRADEWN